VENAEAKIPGVLSANGSSPETSLEEINGDLLEADFWTGRPPSWGP
jgi:hypothetical protein